MSKPGPFSSDCEATVVSASRRHISLTPDFETIVYGTAASKALTVVAGDRVIFHQREGHPFVHSVLPRRNVVARSYRDEQRDIVANIDHLFVVSAVPPLFNTLFVDRVAVVANTQGIAWSLIVNKVDLGTDQAKELIDLYVALGCRVLLTSAKFGHGMEALNELLQDRRLHVVALAGVSGVGKSTILNKLIPEANRRTGEVSEKTGQGKQTTTQASGFVFERSNAPGLLVVDLPGVQNFGVGHLSRSEVLGAFPELVEHGQRCEFSDCAHVRERTCAVRTAVECGEIPGSRYASYVHMCEEIEAARQY